MNYTITTFEEVLQGKRKFPNGFWSDKKQAWDNARMILRYLVLEKYQMDRKTCLETVSTKFFKVNKIHGMLLTVEHANQYRLVSAAIPEWHIHPWEMHVENNFWKEKQHAIEAIRWLFYVKCKFRRSDLTHKYLRNLFQDHKIDGIYNYHDVLEIIQEALPEYGYEIKDNELF